jgi:Transglycosylase SLT domain
VLVSLRGLGVATPPAPVLTALQNASAQYGVPLPLLESVAFAESSYNPSVTSSAGAQGLMQIMPANDSTLGITNPFDVQQSANAGAQYLSQLYAQYGNWNTALIAYNEGPGNLASQGPFASSQTYASGILANAGLSPSSTTAQTSADSTTASGDATAGILDLSSVIPTTPTDSGTDFSITDDSGNLTTVGWVAIGGAGLAFLLVIGLSRR